MARKQVGAAPSSATDAATKGYVDTAIGGTTNLWQLEQSSGVWQSRSSKSIPSSARVAWLSEGTDTPPVGSDYAHLDDTVLLIDD